MGGNGGSVGWKCQALLICLFQNLLTVIESDNIKLPMPDTISTPSPDVFDFDGSYDPFHVYCLPCARGIKLSLQSLAELLTEAHAVGSILHSTVKAHQNQLGFSAALSITSPSGRAFFVGRSMMPTTVNEFQN